MRSRKNLKISPREVHTRAHASLVQTLLVKDHGRLCTATVLLDILLLAAARVRSLFAICADLVNGPSDQAVRNALRAQLPKRIRTLEKRLNEALAVHIPSRLKRLAWAIAIDYHLIPYYGETTRTPKQLYRSQSKAGTTWFHAYATACIVEHGYRTTVGFTWVKAGEAMTTVLERLLAQIHERDVKIRRLVMDRGFFSVAVMRLLQDRRVPYVMPVVFRGRKPKDPRKAKGLRIFLRKAVGWYTHQMRNGQASVSFRVCVAAKWYRHHRTKKRCYQKLIYAAWRVQTTPKELRQWYRRRFGIETSYRQLRQALIPTCTPDPSLRLLFVGIALVLRNVWVWLHLMVLAEQRGKKLILHLELLRLAPMLDWIAAIGAATFLATLQDSPQGRPW
jgi:hypothetical protein